MDRFHKCCRDVLSLEYKHNLASARHLLKLTDGDPRKRRFANPKVCETETAYTLHLCSHQNS